MEDGDVRTFRLGAGEMFRWKVGQSSCEIVCNSHLAKHFSFLVAIRSTRVFAVLAFGTCQAGPTNIGGQLLNTGDGTKASQAFTRSYCWHLLDRHAIQMDLWE